MTSTLHSLPTTTRVEAHTVRAAVSQREFFTVLTHSQPVRPVCPNVLRLHVSSRSCVGDVSGGALVKDPIPAGGNKVGRPSKRKTLPSCSYCRGKKQKCAPDCVHRRREAAAAETATGNTRTAASAAAPGAAVLTAGGAPSDVAPEGQVRRSRDFNPRVRTRTHVAHELGIVTYSEPDRSTSLTLAGSAVVGCRQRAAGCRG